MVVSGFCDRLEKSRQRSCFEAVRSSALNVSFIRINKIIDIFPAPLKPLLDAKYFLIHTQSLLLLHCTMINVSVSNKHL